MVVIAGRQMDEITVISLALVMRLKQTYTNPRFFVVLRSSALQARFGGPQNELRAMHMVAGLRNTRFTGLMRIFTMLLEVICLHSRPLTGTNEQYQQRDQGHSSIKVPSISRRSLMEASDFSWHDHE